MRRQDLIGIMVGSKSVEKVDKQQKVIRDEIEVDVKWKTAKKLRRQNLTVDFKTRQEANDFGPQPDKSGGEERQLAFLRSSAEKN